MIVLYFNDLLFLFISDDKRFKPIYVMPCLCVRNKTWVNLTQSQIQEYLINELHISNNSTALAKNKLRSRSDPRQNSTILGIAGSALICILFVVLFLSDMPFLILQIRVAVTGRPELIRQLRRETMKKKKNKQLKKKSP